MAQKAKGKPDPTTQKNIVKLKAPYDASPPRRKGIILNTPKRVQETDLET